MLDSAVASAFDDSARGARHHRWFTVTAPIALLVAIALPLVTFTTRYSAEVLRISDLGPVLWPLYLGVLLVLTAAMLPREATRLVQFPLGALMTVLAMIGTAVGVAHAVDTSIVALPMLAVSLATFASLLVPGSAEVRIARLGIVLGVVLTGLFGVVALLGHAHSGLWISLGSSIAMIAGCIQWWREAR
jgi:hypothetical protein